MPFLMRRRSTLDVVLNEQHSVGYEEKPKDSSSPAAALAPPLHVPTSIPTRPFTAHPVSQVFRAAEAERPASPPIQDATPATRRFNMLRWRHFSDTQLAATAKMHAAQEERPPVPDLPTIHPTAPAIITTAPTMELSPPKKPKTPFKRQLSKLSPFINNNPDQQQQQQQPQQQPQSQSPQPRRSADHAEHTRYLPPWRKSFDQKRERKEQLHRSSTAHSNRNPTAPPAYGDESNSALALPVERLSVSSAGDRSSGEHVTYATTTTTHTISTTTTLFKLPRRNKKSLFPLPVKFDPPQDRAAASPSPASPRASTSAVISARSSAESPQGLAQTPHTTLVRRHTDVTRPRLLTSPSVSPSHHSLARSAGALATQTDDPLLRNDSSNSTRSANSSPVLAPPRRFVFRDRSSTVGSFGRNSEDLTPPTPPTLASARNSTSTSGRTSLGGFLNLNRFRHGSESYARNSSPASRSKSNSFALSREALVIPEREEGDTPGKYLERLQATVSRSVIAGILSKSSDPFAQAVLRSYSRKFPFFGEPIDMSLRKFLLEAELPKETQQVDRVIQAFADRYHECNPGIFQSSDKAYIVAFSLMMLHTDAFNKNNKRKMQKQDYVKNTSGQNVSDDILACFYDNICYTPFIHFDEEVDINGERLLSFKPRKSKLRGTIPDPVRKTSGPIDPYALICDGKLDMLRPNIKDTINMDDPYTYLGTAGTLDINKLQKAFVNTAVIQIISARSRPAAFESQATRDNPSEAAAGVVDLKITKVGLLWRKNAKRKKARSPWQEWGAVMTGSQLYLFKNLAWIRGLMAQQQAHNKQGNSSAVVFKPPIQDFKPDALIKTDDAVALLDGSYTRHKHSFTLVRQGGQEEVFLTEGEPEMNEWIALINYAAAFRSAGVRIRGFIGGTENDSGSRSKSVSQSEGEALARKETVAPELAQQVLVFRGQIMRQTIFESEREIEQLTNSLEGMLRNARHMLLLAPIQQKSREEVMHAAARMNAMLKWVRRDIWRMKCHRDILARDLELDGSLGEKPPQFQTFPPPPAVTVSKVDGPQESSSRPGSVASPPLSPQSPKPRTVAGSAAEEFFGTDVFKTPPEHARRLEPTDDWKLPPLDLNIDQSPQRLSLAGTAQSIPRQHSSAGVSITSSVGDRQPSFAGSDVLSRPVLDTPGASFADREREALMLARDDLVPTITGASVSTGGAAKPYDLAPGAIASESASKTKSRRSLHRTLREAARHDHGSIHRHRRGKESASTVKSDSSRAGDLSSENTPVLERATGKFIVHGKKASVITFGGDWTEEKMRIRREMEARSETIDDADESGPEANLRRQIELEIAAADDMDGFASDSTAPATIRTMSDADTHISSPGYQRSRQPQSPAANENGMDSYFDIGSPDPRDKSAGRTQRPTFTQPVYPPPTQEIIQDAACKDLNIAPEQMPLPSSPPTTFGKDEEEKPPYTKHLADDELRHLSGASERENTQRDQQPSNTQAVGA